MRQAFLSLSGPLIRELQRQYDIEGLLPIDPVSFGGILARFLVHHQAMTSGLGPAERSIVSVARSVVAGGTGTTGFSDGSMGNCAVIGIGPTSDWWQRGTGGGASYNPGIPVAGKERSDVSSG